MSSRPIHSVFLRLNETAIEAKEGNQGSYKIIVDTLAPRMRGVALKICPRGGSAVDEMITDGVTSIANAVDKWNPQHGTSFATYCMRCAENAMLNRMRHIRRYQRETAIDSVSEVFLSSSEPVDAFESTEDLVGLTKHGDIAVKTIDQMSPQQKKLILSILSGRSIADAAMECGITEDTAKRRLKTALQFIQFDIQRHEESQSED